jgi:KaiC/GvpD/RAD55 family RecA-like ATPase
MRRKEINERSPVRVLDASINGGLKPGDIGVVVARHGVGKTAFLVSVALDDLMRGRKVLHVSLVHDSERVIAFYDEVFSDLARERALENTWKVRVDLERNRRIHCYLQSTFSTEKLKQSLAFMGEHGDFRPVAIMIDGYPFKNTSAAEMRELRTLAEEANAELWMTAVTHRDSAADERGLPEVVASLADEVDVVLSMAHDDRNVHVTLLKDYENIGGSDLKLALDPTTMLLKKER